MAERLPIENMPGPDGKAHAHIRSQKRLSVVLARAQAPMQTAFLCFHRLIMLDAARRSGYVLQFT